MGELEKHCDAVLNWLKNQENKEAFWSPKSVFIQAQVPLDDINSILKTLGDNEHIDFEPVHYTYSNIRINEKGLALLDGLGYVGTIGINTEIRKHIFLKAEADTAKVKEKLEFEQLRLSVQELKAKVGDYPKLKARAKRAEIWVIISVILSALAILLSVIIK